MATNPFAGRSTRILSVPDVLSLIDMRETIEVQAPVRAPTARNDMMKKHGS